MYCLLQGLIDPVKELSKLDKKHELLKQSITKLEQAMAAPDYEVKLPEEVREANSEKLIQNKGELERLIDAMTALKTME